MEIVQRLGIKIPNSVIVSGLLESEEDEEILDFLKKYGSLRTVPVVDPTSEFYKNLIVEYESGSAIDTLAPLLPYTHTLKDNPSAKYYVTALASVYTAKVGGSVTKSYLDELKALAKLSGKEFEEVLKEMVSEITETIDDLDNNEDMSSHTLEENSGGASHLNTSETSPPQLHIDPPQLGPTLNGAESRPSNTVKRSPSIEVSDLNPPEIQRVIVEHIVRKDDMSAHSYSPIRLRSFSGRIPRPSGETDYDTWRSHVELLRKDPAMSDLQRSRKIFESLLSPAADIVKRLSPEATSEAYLQLLDAAFGTVEDGEELFAQFMNTLQDPGEKPSAYLCRLQVALNLAVRRGGIAAEEADKHILKQFCRGCWDNTLLSDLNLEEKKSHPPSFSEFLLMLRTEEDRQTVKATRMKKHLGSTRQRALAHSQSTCACGEPQTVLQPDSNSYTDLKKQVAALQSQLTTLMSKKTKKTSKPKGDAEYNPGEEMRPDNTKAVTWKPANPRPNTQPRPWYCFNCGEDGHIATACSNDPNPTLVTEKRRQLTEKRRVWGAQNHPSDNTHLN